MKPSARHAADVSRVIVVAACAASAGAHAALVPAHLEHERALGVAFLVAAALTVALSVTLTIRPSSAAASRAASLMLTTLIAAYALSVTTGIPWLGPDAEPIDAIGVATKAVEALGLGFALQLHPTPGGRRSLTHKEARS